MIAAPLCRQERARRGCCRNKRCAAPARGNPHFPDTRPDIRRAHTPHRRRCLNDAWRRSALLFRIPASHVRLDAGIAPALGARPRVLSYAWPLSQNIEDGNAELMRIQQRMCRMLRFKHSYFPSMRNKYPLRTKQAVSAGVHRLS
jgi:hypothetical protein